MGKDRVLGIMGGGQLARMLAESASRLGLPVIPLAGHSAEPAAKICPQTIYGSFQDPVTVQRFLSQVTHVIFENEFVPCELIAQCAEQVRTQGYAQGHEVEFLPKLETLFQLQDKIRQKEILKGLGIPSAPYEVMPRGSGLEWAQVMLGRWPEGCVFKWAQQGYDGKGTFIASPRSEDPAGRLKTFFEQAVQKRVPLYAEQRVRFKRELAVVASLSTAGEFKAYPLVVSEQRAGICRRVQGPATTALGVDPALEQLAHQYARKLSLALALYGTFALEFFETEKGELWVNEIAPRVHNTGHYTQDASRTSQFENHLRGVLGLPLGATESAPAFAMLNLLGPEGAQVDGELAEIPPIPARLHWHWYAKRELRPGRKLGHINAVAEKASELPEILEELDQAEKNWVDVIRKPIRKQGEQA